jgi:hypothetical protein
MTLQPILLERALPERGVLWLYPESGGGDDSAEKEDDNSLMQLHRRQLELAFPACLDLSQKGDHEKFRPHVTLSHFKKFARCRGGASTTRKVCNAGFGLCHGPFLLAATTGSHRIE